MTIQRPRNQLAPNDVITGGELEGQAQSDWERLQSISTLEKSILHSGNPACNSVAVVPVTRPDFYRPADDFGQLIRF